MLQPNDLEYLARRWPGYSVTNEASMICVVVPNFPLPDGFTSSESTLLLRLSTAYPDIQPDMWWFAPAIQRQDGGVIAMTQVQEQHLGRVWQRWSRHLGPGQWRPGVDSLENYIALVQSDLMRAAPMRAA